LPPATLLPEIRRAVQRVEPAQPIHAVATMREIAAGSISRERVGSVMMTFFALAALLMATLGVYGVIAYTVRQGTAEIGTRMALGATGRDVLTLFLGSGLKMAIAGLIIGGLATAAATRVLTSAFEIADLGWLPFVASTAFVAGVATIASLFPAWRASTLSPMSAIRRTTT
jgi:putative ABC transport system permease protein